MVRRRWYGLPLLAAGTCLVALEIAWTTRDPAGNVPYPPYLVNAAIFLLGLAGLLMIYLGFRLLAGR